MPEKKFPAEDDHSNASCPALKYDVKKLAKKDAKFNPPGHCRGSKLLHFLTGVVILARDGILKPCRKQRRVERKLTVYVVYESSLILDAALVTLDLAVEDEIDLSKWIPPVSGNFSINARLHWLDDDCDKTTQVYLGASEPRCQQWTPCKSPRLDRSCDKLLYTGRKYLAETPKLESPLRLRRQCRDGETFGGYWKNLPLETAENDYTGDPTSVLRSGDTNKKNFVQWRYSRPECLYHYFSELQARDCLSRTFIAFCGDSLMRGLYSSMVKALGGSEYDDVDLKQAIKNKKAKLTVDIGSTRLTYAQMWLTSEVEKMTKELTKGWNAPSSSSSRPPFDRIVVFANFGAVHMLHAACSREKFPDVVERGLKAINGVLPHINDTILATPSSILARRNPGMSTTKGKVIGDALRAFENVSIIDLGNLTRARFDATLDGVHYGQTVEPTTAVVALNMLCPAPL